MGDGAKRCRRYNFGWNEDRCTSDGSAAEFDELFLVQPLVNGSVYLQYTDQKRAATHDHYAQLHSFYANMGEAAPVEHILTAKETQRLHIFLENHQTKSDADGTLIVDFEQNPEFHSYGAFVPSLQTHGKQALVSADGTLRLFTATEYLFLQGLQGNAYKMYAIGLCPHDSVRLAPHYPPTHILCRLYV